MRGFVRLKRDLIAATLATGLLSPLLVGFVGTGQPVAGAPGTPDVGIWAKETSPQKPLTPASQRTEVPAQPAPSSPPENKKPAAEQVTQPATARKPEPPKAPSEPMPSPAAATTPKPAAPAEQSKPEPRRAEGQPAGLAAEPPPKPTPVEPQPQQVTQMSPEAVRKAVEAYRSWVHRGRIRLRVDHALLTPEQLRAVAEVYVLTTKNSQLRVDQTGQVTEMTPDQLRQDTLVGDVPAAKWPEMLVQKASSYFGPDHAAEASFLFTDACTLRLFRTLAQAVGSKPVPPGSEFTLQLCPDAEGRIGVKLLKANVKDEREPSP